MTNNFPNMCKLFNMKYILFFILIINSCAPPHSKETYCKIDINNLESRSYISKSAKPYSLLLLGDIMLTKKAELMVSKKGISYPFGNIVKDFAGHDITFANLEVSITTSIQRIIKKKYRFKLSPKYAESLTKLNLDVVSLANNHLLDYGRKGMRDTISWLDKKSIKHTGAGKNKKQARKPAITTVNGIDIIWLAYNERPPKKYFATTKRGGTARLYEPAILWDIKKYKKKGNIVLVSLHWGFEHTNIPRGYQIKRARKLIDAGADGIIGHHPHRPQSIEIYKKRPIFYSLGNFISGFDNPLYMDNIAVSLHYKKTELKRVEIFSIEGKNLKGEYRPHVIKNKIRLNNNIKHLISISKKFKTQIKTVGYKGIITL
jgi:poly-gamma-glutamate capsule biosynthesis protein CapA/YwtB (metallophosphatase superfamily)